MFFKTSVGIDFREQQIIAAAVRMQRGKLDIMHIKLHRFAQQWLAPDRTDSGVNNSELVLQLKRAMSSGEGRRMKRGNAHLGVPTQLIVLRRISDLPDVPADEIRRILSFEINENIPLPFAEPVYDFVKVGAFRASADRSQPQLLDEAAVSWQNPGASDGKEDERGCEVILFATSRMLAEKLAKAARGAKLKPVSAEIKGLSLMRFIHYLCPEWLKEFEIVLDMGEHSFDLHIYLNGMIVFSRNVAVNKWDYLKREARDQTDGFMDSSLPFADEAEYFDLQRYAEDAAQEIERAVNFFRYSMNERERPVKRLVMVGQCGDALKDRLAPLTGFAVETPDFSKLRQGRYHPDALLSAASAAIGLALRGCFN
jgi:type IV pilus assembly protein PilM